MFQIDMSLRKRKGLFCGILLLVFCGAGSQMRTNRQDSRLDSWKWIFNIVFVFQWTSCFLRTPVHVRFGEVQKWPTRRTKCSLYLVPMIQGSRRLNFCAVSWDLCTAYFVVMSVRSTVC